MAIDVARREAMTDALVIGPICVAAQRIKGVIAGGRSILIKRRARRSMLVRRLGGGSCSRTVEVGQRSISSIVHQRPGGVRRAILRSGFGTIGIARGSWARG